MPFSAMRGATSVEGNKISLPQGYGVNPGHGFRVNGVYVRFFTPSRQSGTYHFTEDFLKLTLWCHRLSYRQQSMLHLLRVSHLNLWLFKIRFLKISKSIHGSVLKKAVTEPVTLAVLMLCTTSWARRSRSVDTENNTVLPLLTTMLVFLLMPSPFEFNWWYKKVIK